jgi:hypothetical protein
MYSLRNLKGPITKPEIIDGFGNAKQSAELHCTRVYRYSGGSAPDEAPIVLGCVIVVLLSTFAVTVEGT